MKNNYLQGESFIFFDRKQLMSKMIEDFHNVLNEKIIRKATSVQVAYNQNNILETVSV